VKRKQRTRRDPQMGDQRAMPRSVAGEHNLMTKKRTRSAHSFARGGRSHLMAAAESLSWERDGRDWPNRAASRFVRTAGLLWHVQQFGRGPVLLLLHGTGTSTHSWRALAPLLAAHFTMVAPDMPGHGFTETPQSEGFSLRGMAKELGELLGMLALDPVMAVGHSAGAAVMIRMTIDGTVRPRALVSLNGALLPFAGIASQFLSPLAKLMVLNPFVPRLFARHASDRPAVERLIRNTGSTIDQAGIELYRRLVSSPRHVAAALAMMANWDLGPLARDLSKLTTPLLLVAGSADRAVSTDEAFKVRERVPSAKVELVRGLGHLAHEERPEQIADIIIEWASVCKILKAD
jgi:magnesium chelatase accessory protein